MYPYSTNFSQYKEKNIDNNMSINSRQDSFIKQDKKVLELIQTAIDGSSKLANIYNNMSNMTSNSTDKKILHDMYLCELKHSKFLNEIYYISSGEKAQQKNSEPMNQPDSYSKCIEDCIINCVEFADFLTSIISNFLNLEIRDMLTEIINENQNSAIKLNFLLIRKK